MVSRLLSSIDSKLKRSLDPNTRMCLLADRAGLLARLGHSGEARKQIDELRTANIGYDAGVTCRILISEGLLGHFSYDLSAARDRFRRAFAISSAVGDTRLRALAAAWLSVNELQFDNISAAAEMASLAVRDAHSEDYGALARAHLVIADLLNYGGDQDGAASHYKIARQFAVEEGDLSMQSLVLFNFAAFRVHRLALDQAQGSATAEQASLAELDVASIRNLDQGIGNKSLSRMVPLLHGQVLAMQGRWAEAIDRFGDHIEHAEGEGLERELAKALTCRAMCFRALDRQPEMSADVAQTMSHLSHCSDLDDLAIVHHRLHAVLSEADPGAATEHLAAFNRSMSAFLQRQKFDLALVRKSLA